MELQSGWFIFQMLEAAGVPRGYTLAICFLAFVVVFTLFGWRLLRIQKRIAKGLETFFGRSKEITVEQARLYYAARLHLMRHEIENFYFRTLERNRARLELMEEDIRNQFEDFFRMMYESSLEDLGHFCSNGKRLSDYQKTVQSELGHIKTHLCQVTFNQKAPGNSEVPYFLRRKFESIVTAFGLYLQGEGVADE